MPLDLFGIDCPQDSPLRPVLEQWVKANLDICTIWEQQCRNSVPWWYSEQVCVSIFAGCVWRAGGFCLEELPVQEKKRVDTHFSIRDTTYWGEAKVAWNTQGCASSLMQAEQQIRDYRHHYMRPQHVRLAILFFSPEVQSDKALGEQTLLGNLEKWNTDLKELGCCARAFVYPAMARKPAFGHHKKMRYPGAEILIREIPGPIPSVTGDEPIKVVKPQKDSDK